MSFLPVALPNRHCSDLVVARWSPSPGICSASFGLKYWTAHPHLTHIFILQRWQRCEEAEMEQNTAGFNSV